MHLVCAAEPESSHMLYIFGSCDAWIALGLWIRSTNFGWPIFQWANGFSDRIGHAFFHCSMDRPISAWYHTSVPWHYTPPGTSRSSCHKEEPLHVCLLSFAWLYIGSMDMLFRRPWGSFLFISSFCTSLWGPTCHYLCSTQYGYCKDSNAISILFLQIAFLH